MYTNFGMYWNKMNVSSYDFVGGGSFGVDDDDEDVFLFS